MWKGLTTLAGDVVLPPNYEGSFGHRHRQRQGLHCRGMEGECDWLGGLLMEREDVGDGLVVIVVVGASEGEAEREGEEGKEGERDKCERGIMGKGMCIGRKGKSGGKGG